MRDSDKGSPIKYLSEQCPKCGRVRVELWGNGDKICEKCHWNQSKEKYEPVDY